MCTYTMEITLPSTHTHLLDKCNSEQPWRRPAQKQQFSCCTKPRNGRLITDRHVTMSPPSLQIPPAVGGSLSVLLSLGSLPTDKLSPLQHWWEEYKQEKVQLGQISHPHSPFAVYSNISACFSLLHPTLTGDGYLQGEINIQSMMRSQMVGWFFFYHDGSVVSRGALDLTDLASSGMHSWLKHYQS